MTMKIAKDTVVSFHYRLLDEQGKQIESSAGRDPNVVLIGHRNVLPALEEAMLGKAAGDGVNVSLPPEKAYGLRREGAVQRIPTKHVLTKGKLQPGQAVQINTEHGARNVTVAKVGKFNIDIDTNHPLAGKTVVFDISIIDVRAASAEELSHGHAHGVGGHHH
jgi:FKBP-type peptidyl-prolyl cis-trans isomerase SlyD